MSGSTSKPPRDWVEADIADLITNGVKEDLNLDYKACASLQKTDGRKADISKDVSALANSAGGTIVYGVKEDGQVPTEIDEGYDPADISKEWLENVINSTIKPRIDGIVINQVELSTVKPGRVLYVVDIPQTQAGGPHQAHDHRYYKRFNFQSVPMEDYEIRDVMRRALGPDLSCTFQVGAWGDFEEPATDLTFYMAISLENNSPEPALYAHLDFFLDERVELQFSQSLVRLRTNIDCLLGSQRLRMNHFSREWVAPNDPPVWRGIGQRIERDPMTLLREDGLTRFNALIRLYAPHMVPKTHIVEIRPWHHDAQERVKPRDDLTFREVAR